MKKIDFTTIYWNLKTALFCAVILVALFSCGIKGKPIPPKTYAEDKSVQINGSVQNKATTITTQAVSPTIERQQ